MAFTPQQEAYLARFADDGLASEAYDAKVIELNAARSNVNNAVVAKYAADLASPDGAIQKKAIAALQAEISADPYVAQLTSELDAMKL